MLLAVAAYPPARGLVVGFAVLVPLERLFARHRQKVLRPGLGTDLVHFLFTGVLNSALVLVGAVAGYLATVPWRPAALATVGEQLGAGGRFAFSFIVFNVASYWQHRLSHRNALLWRVHSVHHSSTELDWIAAARLHPFEGLSLGLIAAPPFALFGVQPMTVAGLSALFTLWAIVLHANVRWRLRRLEPFVSTPEYHRWHHELTVANKNFAGLLPILDTVFGTRHRPAIDERPQRYGIDGPMASTWRHQMLWPLRPRVKMTPF